MSLRPPGRIIPLVLFMAVFFIAAPAWSQTAPPEGPFCTTFERWFEKYGKDEQWAGSNCPQQGMCDDPGIRDSYIPDANTPVLTVRMRIVVFAEDSGNNPASTQSEVDAQMAQLNLDYADSKFQFTWETVFVNDTEYRYFVGGEENGMKTTYAADTDQKLNVFVVTYDGGSFGTFPWSNDALTSTGGIVMTTFHWGPGRSVLAHEVGHNLGLWHTHHGVSEVNACSACWERADGVNGDTTGDRCSDTAPTPRNYSCGDPGGTDGCSGDPWGATDFRNYMGYAPDTSCTNYFSTQQMGRTQCWFDDRLTGWLGVPPSLIFTFPQGLPFYVAPGQATPFQMQIQGGVGIVPEPASGKMFVSINGGAYNEVAISHLGGELYDVTLPSAPPCGGRMNFYFSGESTDNDVFFSPAGAPTDSYEAISAYGTRVVYTNNFDLDTTGWSVVDNPSLSGGGWEVADPNGTRLLGMDAAPPSPSQITIPNELAWVTENGLVDGLAQDSDVDGGPTDLISPVFDLSAGGGTITFSRWFFTNGDDFLTVWVTNDGVNWTLVDTIGGFNENAWSVDSFRVEDYVTPTSTVQVRFRVGDVPDDSITEAAIELFQVEELVCTACVTDVDCQGPVFCNGAETCDAGGFCEPGFNPCAGQICDEANDVCVECFLDDDCDDESYCNGVETCDTLTNTCNPGSDPCPSDPCDETFDVCVTCLTNPECDDGIFCNGAEICGAPGYCTPGPEACPGYCDEAGDDCIGNVEPQQQPGLPLFDLDAEQLMRYEAGKLAFQRLVDDTDGLGPVYNATSCAACHTTPLGGPGTAVETRFGFDDGLGNFDPLTELGGPILQTDALSAPCLETVPPEANMTATRISSSTLGAGLIESIPDADLRLRADMPPGNVSGATHEVTLLEDPGGILHVGRFGRKAVHATALSAAGHQALYQLGLTNRLIRDDTAPNGDPVLLGQCDSAADPEDDVDLDGYDLIARVTDFMRYSAAPPQTPRSGMNGEVLFGVAGCLDCHISTFTTSNDDDLEFALRSRTVRAYSDFLVHDMGSDGEATAEGTVLPNEVRTAPLWGVRYRERLWHDGQIGPETYPTLPDRVRAAVVLHGAAGSEGADSVAAFNGLAPVQQDFLLGFVASLGRLEFDMDGDDDVDFADQSAVLACFSGPNPPGPPIYPPDDACAVADVDQDGDVDDDDLELFDFLAVDDSSGSIPNGDDIPGSELTIGKGSGGFIDLQWGDSCVSRDVDYAVYEGCIGDWATHVEYTCTTGGASSYSLVPFEDPTYYLIVPSNGQYEGSYGYATDGSPRALAAGACLPQKVAATCDP